MARGRTGALGWLAVIAAVLTMPGCYHGAAGAPAPHPRVKEAQDAARQAMAVEESRPVWSNGSTPTVLGDSVSGLSCASTAMAWRAASWASFTRG